MIWWKPTHKPCKYSVQNLLIYPSYVIFLKKKKNSDLLDHFLIVWVYIPYSGAHCCVHFNMGWIAGTCTQQTQLGELGWQNAMVMGKSCGDGQGMRRQNMEIMAKTGKIHRKISRNTHIFHHLLRPPTDPPSSQLKPVTLVDVRSQHPLSEAK